MTYMRYSVIIRTLHGGDKYLRLLKSIEAQTIKAEQVYVVQPEGYSPPKESLGNENFIHTKKGMWSQRIYGMEYVYSLRNHPEYILVCDDDVEFSSTFIEQLLKIAKEMNIDTLIPIEDSRAGKLKKIIGAFTGERTENKKSVYKITIKRNGRFSVNNDLTDNVNPTQSGPFQCFLMNTDIVPKLALREEMWLDETRYAWPDDQVFFYKSHLKGLRNFSCKKPGFKHLDGKAGVTDKERKMDIAYGRARNLVIFWKKFIYPQRHGYIDKILTRVSFNYYLLVNSSIMFALALREKDMAYFNAFRKGITAGKNYKL